MTYFLDLERSVDVSDHLRPLLLHTQETTGCRSFFLRISMGLYYIEYNIIVSASFCLLYRVLLGFCIYYSQYIVCFHMGYRSPDVHPAMMVVLLGVGLDCFRSVGKY